MGSSGSKQPAAAATTSVLTTVLTLEGHTKSIPSISYFPDGKHIVSGSYDNTSRRWDLQTGKEIEESRDVWEQEVDAVAVSRNGRWIITAGGDSNNCGEIKARDVEMGIIRTFQGHSDRINCIDISADNRLLASGAEDRTACIWSLNTGQLVAGPFKSADRVGAIRFSLDSKKLAVKSGVAKCLEVWDVQAQKLDVKLGKYDRRRGAPISDAPVLWTMKAKSIVAAFSFKDENPNRIYEFDASTLQTIGASFEGHTDTISGLALSFDCILSASADQTIKLWAFQSRQLLASFSIQKPCCLILSPDSSQVAYTTYDDTKIYICNTPPDILATLRPRISDPDDLPPEAMFQDLTKYITMDGNYPVAVGGFSDIWKCTYSLDRRSTKVAVKSLRVYPDDRLGPAKKIKRITRELRIRANLKHKNILPVYGYTDGFGPFIALVSPWAEYGDLMIYLEYVGADLTLVRRFQILRDIIAGLQYLHANSVIHGNFSGPNVLIHGDGTACVTGFGLSLMHSGVISASQTYGNVRWLAPELLEDRDDGSLVRPSEQSDIFSFGGIMLQVLTNKIPYYYYLRNVAIIMAIVKSQTPSRSHYPVLPDKYWQFIEKCWSTDPQDRPSTEIVDREIKNEFHSLSGSPENSDFPVLQDLTRYITEDEEYTAAAVDLTRYITEDEEYAAAAAVDLTRYITEDEEYAGAVDGFGEIHDLTTYIKKDEEYSEYPVAAGAFGEIWKCIYEKDRTSIKVAVKSLRVYADDLSGVKKEKKIKRIQRELIICANMKHKNILPVYGYTTGFGPFMAIVSLWAENGNLTTYLKGPTGQGIALAVVERFRILNDIIAGLHYLHDNHVIHGDFTGNNVLIYGDGTACIADFGLSLQYSEVISASKAPWTSAPIQGNLPWMSPELFEERRDGSEVRPSQQSDIYSFGGIMLQVLTNEIPYYYTTHQLTIIGWIAQSKKPDRTRYPDVPDEYWRIIERCWSTVPQDRPSTKQVKTEIRNEFSSLLDLANS